MVPMVPVYSRRTHDMFVHVCIGVRGGWECIYVMILSKSFRKLKICITVNEAMSLYRIYI